MKYCPKCGAQLADEAAFCDKCGSALGQPAAPAGSEPVRKEGSALGIAALKKAVDAGDQATVEKYAKLLYGQALLLADLPLEDPSEYAELVCSLMV